MTINFALSQKELFLQFLTNSKPTYYLFKNIINISNVLTICANSSILMCQWEKFSKRLDVDLSVLNSVQFFFYKLIATVSLPKTLCYILYHPKLNALQVPGV